MSNESSSKPMYEKIFETLRERIVERKYEIGERVPSEKELAEEYNVSRITSKKALELLAGAGLIVRKPGRGSFVAGLSPSEPVASAVADKTPASKPTRRTLIGLVITDFADSYGTGLLYGMEAASRENDCFLVLRRTFGIPGQEEEAIRGLLDLGVDGLIVFPAQGEYFNAEILKLVIEQFPLVLVDRHLKGISAASVSTDNVSAARKGTDYLFQLGHRHIGLLTPPPLDTTAVEDRIEGFVQAHAEKGIMVDRGLWMTDITSTLPNSFHDPNIEQDIRKIQGLLQRNPHITALFASEYNMALVAKAAAQQMDLRIPEDISIVCFDNPPSGHGGGYCFTHLQQNQESMGHTAMEYVLKLGAGHGVPNKTLLDARLIIGESTAAAREDRPENK